MSRRTEHRAPKLIEDGRGYKTPLRDKQVIALSRRVAAAPPPIRYDAPKLRKLHEPRPAPAMPRVRSMLVGWLQWLVVVIVVGFSAFHALAWLGARVSPDLAPLPTGIVPYGPRVIFTFGLYAITGCMAGAGVGYWMLRSGQN